jgi:hypothetical protein
LCHKQNYILLTTLITNPKQVGIDIDVFLETLMEDMRNFGNMGSLYGMTTTNKTLI